MNLYIVKYIDNDSSEIKKCSVLARKPTSALLLVEETYGKDIEIQDLVFVKHYPDIIVEIP